VKCTVIFRGREIQHTALAEVLLMRMAKDLEENAEIQQPPKREGRNMIMFLSPRKLSSGKPTGGEAKPKPVKTAAAAGAGPAGAQNT
jgi:translation initiation factor IF-3